MIPNPTTNSLPRSPTRLTAFVSEALCEAIKIALAEADAKTKAISSLPAAPARKARPWFQIGESELEDPT